jgi:hypothetical protein
MGGRLSLRQFVAQRRELCVSFGALPLGRVKPLPKRHQALFEPVDNPRDGTVNDPLQLIDRDRHFFSTGAAHAEAGRGRSWYRRPARLMTMALAISVARQQLRPAVRLYRLARPAGQAVLAAQPVQDPDLGFKTCDFPTIHH